ncbi:hypothetical protein BK139_06925 [Paenibacillus sp. FSL R5-0490]|uniref:Wadjet anti-phage system protein JetA family protein n=1 Tax=Paenibacillus sp. FSL R5-0490 TaxID=1920424 RepID=UPI00096E6F82|nr:Wadjet anti-phage system protein JetA family protein [Paenibacillus sp. FSL R5-0490]OMF61565.1 hypothetical protein BK139_06925 [Paenibacillus sp. FSL R5-0490]
MKLFDVLPDRFFSLFTGRNKEIYAEAILELYEQYKISRIGIDYGIMRDLLQELIEVKEESGVQFELEEDSSLDTNEMENMHRAKANALLRKLLSLKWIDVETRNNFKHYIILPHYSIRMLSVLHDLCQVRSIEYQSYALSTYQLLSNEGMEKQPSIAIIEAERITEQLLEELRLLINNMKNHMEQVISKQSLQEVLDHHFDVYMKKIVDKSYHRLKTSDHVARYRSKILETVQRWSLDPDLLNIAIEDAMNSELYNNEDEAELKIRAALHFIEETYDSLDELYEQIDIRHHQYIKSSYDRARYLTQHNQGLDHQIATVLESYERTQDYWEELLGDIFRLHNVNQLSEKSLLTPRKKKAVHQAQQHIVVPISQEVKKKIRESNIKRLENAITKQKINAFVLERLGSRDEMGMSELAPKTVEGYIYLPYVYLYGYDQHSEYRLMRNKEQRILHIGEYRFDDRKVIRNS